MTPFVAHNSVVIAMPASLGVIPLLMSILLATVLMATLTLNLVRWKGLICPGQQRRLVKQSYILTFLWGSFSLLSVVLLDGALQVTLLSTLVTMVHVLSLWNMRRLPISISNAIRLAHSCTVLSGLLAISTAVAFIRIEPRGFSLLITTLLTLGAVFSHVLMVAARCRLQAFHRLLPLIGLFGILAACVDAVYQALHIPVGHILSVSIMVCITIRFILLASGFLFWVWPLIIYNQYAHMEDPKMKAKAVPSLQRLLCVFVLFLCSTLLSLTM
ncbi:hypothetical protein [Plesiomonas sp.]|uniref:hypothetical protein n=1 Tax=Plesiomonas sp. TaxID=2486279 RepID=UPI003F400EFC